MDEILMYLRKKTTNFTFSFTASKFDLKWPSVGEKIGKSKSWIISFLQVLDQHSLLNYFNVNLKQL